MSATEMESLMDAAVEFLNEPQSATPEEVKETDKFLDWAIDNLSKGAEWLGENIGPMIPAFLAML